MPVKHSRSSSSSSSSQLPFASCLSRSFLISFRRDPLLVSSAEHHEPPPPTSPLDLHVHSLQTHVTDLLHTLSSSSSNSQLLSLPWLLLLLDSFLSTHHLFHSTILLFTDATALPRDFLDLSVKSLDVLNAVLDSIDLLRHRHRPLSIALDALLHSPTPSDSSLRRARKALADLSLLDDRTSTATAFALRNRSFERNSTTHRRSRPAGHSRSLSWGLPKAWSASRQLQAIASAIAPPPRCNQGASATAAAAVFCCMSWVLLLVLWVLVAAVGCQERVVQGLPIVPRGFAWGVPMAALHDHVMKEARRRKGCCSGLLKEVQRMERCAPKIAELTLEGDRPAAELREQVEELAKVCEALKEGLDPLERKVREVFRRIVRSRTEVLDKLGLLSTC